MSQLKMWKEHPTWEEAEKAWDCGAEEAQRSHPNKGLNRLPNMPGITPETRRFLKWKALRWMVAKDHNWTVMRGFLRYPFKYGWRYLISLFRPQSYRRDGDFFYYGIKGAEEFKQKLCSNDAVFALGFSYCHKPFECPSGRFTSECIADATNPTCRQCFIGKAIHASPEKAQILIIPTIHYIGAKMFDLVHNNPGKEVLFVITACEMTLEMFSDWGNMAGIVGIGVRLDGRICNTMKAFELSEQGIKPGLTVVLNETQRKILELLKEAHDK